MIIWDEYKYGECLFKSHQVKTRKWQYKELSCLAKYMLLNKNKPKDIREAFNECCQDDLKYLKEYQKRNIFDKIIDRAKKEKVVKDVLITVYQSEIDKIKELDDVNLEKMMFVLLVYDKWLHNMEWFSLMRQDISREAKIGNKDAYKQQEMIQKLYQLGYLNSDVKQINRNSHSKSNSKKKQMWSIPFLIKENIKNENVVFTFDNYVNIVFRYLNYVYGGYFECARCKGVFIKNVNNKLYCKECAKSVKAEQNKGYRLTK